jgi:hypothetical protein
VSLNELAWIALEFLTALPGILALVAAAIATAVIFRHRQLSRPEIEIDLSDESIVDQAGSTLTRRQRRKLKRSKFEILAYTSMSDEPKHIMCFVVGIKNTGKVAAKNIRISIEYDASFALTQKEVKDVYKMTDATAILHSGDGKTAYGVLEEDLESDSAEHLDKRSFSISRSTAYSSFEIPIIRQGETPLLWEPLQCPGHERGIESEYDAAQVGFHNLGRYIAGIDGVHAAFSVKVAVFGDGLRPVERKVIVLFVSGGAGDKALAESGRGFWYGGSPAPGWYFSEAISLWLMRKFGISGRLSPSIKRQALGLCFHPKYGEGTLPSGKPIKFQLIDYTASQIFELGVPNCRLHDIPSFVDSYEMLERWLLIGPPIFRRRRKRVDDQEN